MSELVRCKACGYIMKEDKVGEVCPACNVPAKAFEAYRDPVAPERRKLLDLFLHPILLHFPQALSALIPFFIILVFIVSSSIKLHILVTIKVLAYLLPLTVLGGYITGIFDGRLRFKGLKAPLLRKKIMGGALLLILSTVLALVVYAEGLTRTGITVVGILSLCMAAVEVYLSQIGKTLLGAELPGK